MAARVRSTARRWPGAPTTWRRSRAATSRSIPAAAAVLGAIRKAKSEAKRSMRTDVTARVVARHRPSSGAALEPALDDVRDGGSRRRTSVELVDAAELAVDVTLARPGRRRRDRP